MPPVNLQSSDFELFGLPQRFAQGLDIRLRDEWGADRPPKGPMPPEDVKFLQPQDQARVLDKERTT